MNETIFAAHENFDVENILQRLSDATPGADIDINGCIASAGYVFCEALNICVRLWETECPVSTPH